MTDAAETVLDIDELEKLSAESGEGEWCVHPNGTSIWTGKEYDSAGDTDSRMVFSVPVTGVVGKRTLTALEQSVRDVEFTVELHNAFPRLCGVIRHALAFGDRVGDAAGCDDQADIVERVRALHDRILGTHRWVTPAEGGPDMCGDCGVDLEDAIGETLLCSGYGRLKPDETRPGLVWTNNGEAGDGQNVCEECGTELDEPHTYLDCLKAVRNGDRMAAYHFADTVSSLEADVARLRTALEQVREVVAEGPRAALTIVNVALAPGIGPAVRADPTHAAVRDFARLVAHGSDAHREWLRAAAERYIHGERKLRPHTGEEK